MKSLLACTLALSPLALAACTQDRPAERPTVAPAAKVVGEPQNCVQLSQIRNSRVRDDWTIDFEGPGNRVWRNTLANRCGGLKNGDGFTYETSLTQLCNVDIIYVLQRMGNSLQRGAGCGLGQFVPVELAK